MSSPRESELSCLQTSTRVAESSSMTEMGKKTVLVVSRHPHLEDCRRLVLEQAGYQVITVRNPEQIEAAGKDQKIDLAVIGYSIPTAMKERFVSEVIISCDCPILELWDRHPPQRRNERIFDHFSLAPGDFLSTVNTIFGRALSNASEKPATVGSRKK